MNYARYNIYFIIIIIIIIVIVVFVVVIVIVISVTGIETWIATRNCFGFCRKIQDACPHCFKKSGWNDLISNHYLFGTLLLKPNNFD